MAVKKTQLGDIMETYCHHCKSRFRIAQSQLQEAFGKVRCGECGMVFNALSSIKTYEGKLPANYRTPEIKTNDPHRYEDQQNHNIEVIDEKSELSLHEAMYGGDDRSFRHFSPLLWAIGILLLCTAGIAQAIYYQRYSLIDKPRFQQQVLNLCQFLPCSNESFSSKREIKLLERNVFTHPVEDNALMIGGAFVNQAPFDQKLPELVVSLFNLNGTLIANRSFKAAEYLPQASSDTVMKSGKPIQFRLEIVDPGTTALTYEFEFL
ncbi:MAG: putative Zn finger-like uncharacterized protein [Gammaproteobacteria bacterium]